jgi:two-component system, cell cycle sensor histidine kinase and response regulator CckA
VSDASDGASAPRVVLVVDDDPHIRSLLARWAQLAGHEAVVAADGREALEAAAGLATLDAVVTDVRMPRMDGPELAERLRLARPELPLVFISGYTGLEDRPDAPFQPRAAFLEKPFSLRTFAEAFDRVMHAR